MKLYICLSCGEILDNNKDACRICGSNICKNCKHVCGNVCRVCRM